MADNIKSIVEKYNKIIQDIQNLSIGGTNARIGSILDLAITLNLR